MVTSPQPEPDRLQATRRAFEQGWGTGQRPRLEEVLFQHSPEDRVVLFPQLLLIELQARIRLQEEPTLQEYALRFPDEVMIIKGVLESFSTCRDSTILSSRDSESQHLTEADTPLPVTDFTRVDRFEILRELGSGTFGRVFLAYDPNIKREVALKVLHPKRQLNPAAREAFIHEAQAQAKVDHPHVLPVYAVEQMMGTDIWYIVSKYASRGTLSQRMLQGPPFSLDEIVRIIIPVAHALHASHTQGLYHRDVKPSNILFDARGQVYLADFGLALHEQAQYRKKGQVAGSPAYMAPEQVQGKSHLLDGRADLWSLGILMYEMLAGERPFRGPTISELYEEILEREPRPLSLKIENLPRDLERIVLKCLQKKIPDRYLTAADLAADLERWQKSSRAEPRLPASLLKSPQPVSRGKRWGMIAGFLMLLLGGLAVWRYSPAWDTAPGQENQSLVNPLPESPQPEAIPVEEAVLSVKRIQALFGDDGLWGIHQKENLVQVFSREPSLRSLGEYEQGKLKLHVELPQIAEETTLGLFFGFNPSWQGQKKTIWQVVTLTRRPERVYTITLCLYEQIPGTQSVKILGKSEGSFAGDLLSLTLEIGLSGIDSLMLANTSMEELIRDYHQNKPPGLPSTGLYGLACMEGEGAFRNPVVNDKPYQFQLEQ